MTRTAIAAAALLLALGCGDAPSPDYPEAGAVINGNTISCPQASDVFDYRSGSYHSYSCTWYCANYQGQPARYVDLTYVWNGSTWVLDSEFVSNGICG